MFLVTAWRQTAEIRYKSLRASRASYDNSSHSLYKALCFTPIWLSRLAAPWAHSPWVLCGLRVAEHKKRWHLVVDRLTSVLSTGSVCVSQGVLRFSRDVAMLDPEQLIVIPNGVDLRPFDAAVGIARATLGIPDNAHLALYVGRLDPQKGLVDLLDAAEHVISKRSSWHLVLAGDGPSRPWLLNQLANHEQLGERIHWIGQCGDIPALLATANVLVHASLWEGMPNVVLEAMAAGLPVIGTAVEGTEDLVLPGQTGWLVPPHQPPTLSRALIEAVDSPETCVRYGQAGRLRVERQFAVEKTVAAYERLWAAVLGIRLPCTQADELDGLCLE